MALRANRKPFGSSWSTTAIARPGSVESRGLGSMRRGIDVASRDIESLRSCLKSELALLVPGAADARDAAMIGRVHATAAGAAIIASRGT